MAACCLAARAAVITGTWTATPGTQPGSWRFTFTRHDVIMDAVGSAEARTADVQGFGHGPAIRWRLVRDAGTITLDGASTTTGGSGTFSFRENPEFLGEARKVVRDWADSGSIFKLALQGTTTVRLAELAARGGTVTSWQLRLGVDRALDPAASLIALRESGFALSREEALRLRTHGVTPDLLRTLRSTGYENLSVTDLERLGSHGISDFDLRLFEARGHRNLPVDEMVRMKVNGIIP